MQPADITAGAAAGDPRCMRATDVFCAVFGAIAGDLVLTTGAWDGVFLTGGVVPRILSLLQHSGFRQRFEHKGRFSPNLARVPSRSEEHTSELQSLMRISSAVLCLQKQNEIAPHLQHSATLNNIES